MDSEIYYESKLKCPICDHEFIMTKTKTKTKATVPIKTETYLIPVYETELANPLSYDVVVCPKCYYSVFYKDFKDTKNTTRTNIAKAYQENRKKFARDIKFNIVLRNYQSARFSYFLAALQYF